jgi:uncharacterized protein YqfA (UPF0365 family)
MTDYRYPLRQRLASALRRSPVRQIQACLRLAEEHQLPVTATQLEAHHLAGGRISDVIEALIFAKQRHLDLPVRRALVQDLAYGKTASIKDWVAACHARGVTNLEREPFT